MSDEPSPLVFQQMIHAAPAEVYLAVTNSTALREWLCDVATLNPQPGGRFYAAWNSGYYTAGEFANLEPNQKIAFTWRGRSDPEPTQVTITLQSQNEATLLTLQHTGFGPGPAWEPIIQEMSRGWRSSLENLASILETGEDLRIVRRPMLGINLAEFTPEIAQKMGVPVDKGIHISGTVEGLGAQRAGLTAGDVIVAMDGHPITDYGSLAAAISRHQAGDQVEVVFYRGPEKHLVIMELSRRALPAIPATSQELADILNDRFAQEQATLEAFFQGVTDQEASYRPGPDEWNAKEVLAHLILGERYTGLRIAELVGGYENFSDDWGGNINAHNNSVAQVRGSVEALLAELRKTWEENVSTYACLPQSFVDRKRSYWRLANEALAAPYHLNEHLAQMSASITAARNLAAVQG